MFGTVVLKMLRRRRFARLLARMLVGASTGTMLAASPALAQSNQWTGAIDSDFGKGGNFSAGVPSGNVVVDFRANQPNVAAYVANVTSLTVQGNGTTFGIMKNGTLNTEGITQGKGTSMSSYGVINTKGPIQTEGTLFLGAGSLLNGGINAKAESAVNVYGGTVNDGVNVTAGGRYFSRASALNGGITNAGSTTLISTPVSGNVVNQGGGNMEFWGIPIKDGSLTNKDTASLTVNGDVTGISNITNTGSAKIFINPNASLEGKTVYNGASAVLENNGKLVSGTWITNIGILKNGSATAEIVGGLDNSGIVDNQGTISGGVKNSGQLSSTDTGVINGGLTNTGKATNAGKVNGGLLNSDTGEFANAKTGIVNGGIVNSGKVSNLGLVNDIVTNKDGTFTNEGKLAGGVTLNGGELISSKAASIIAGGLTNNAKATIAGTLTGAIANNAGAQLIFSGDTHGDGKVTNAEGATFALTGGSVDGLGPFQNNGLITATGTRSLATAAMTNGATGVISMVNNAAGDKLTINGSYAGVAGSRLGIDIDTSAGAAKTVDQIVVNGKASGTSTLTLAFVNGVAGKLDKPVDVITLGAGSTLKLNTGRVSTQPLMSYYLSESAPGSGIYQLSSLFDPTVLMGVTSSITAGLTSYQAALADPIRPIVSRPAKCSPSQITTSPFVRVVGGEDRMSSSQSADSTGGSYASPVKTTNRVSGFQAGIDFGVCNIGGNGWGVNLGLSGGQVSVDGSTTLDSPAGAGVSIPVSAKSSLTMPFFGLHAILNAGGFNLELGLRQDRLNGSVSTSGDGFLIRTGALKAQGYSFNGLASYRFMLPYAFFIEPHVGISSGSMNLGSVALGTGAADTVTLGRISTGMVRGGVNIGTAFRAGPAMIVSPFAHFSLWSQLGGNTVQASVASLGESVSIKGQGGGSFAQVGGGLQVRSAGGGLAAFVKADMRFGEAMQGYAINGGLRLTF